LIVYDFKNKIILIIFIKFIVVIINNFFIEIAMLSSSPTFSTSKEENES